MRRFAAVMLNLLLSGVKPAQVNKDIHPGKTPPKARPTPPVEPTRYVLDPEPGSIEDLYFRFLKSHPERAKFARKSTRLDK